MTRQYHPVPKHQDHTASMTHQDHQLPMTHQDQLIKTAAAAAAATAAANDISTKSAVMFQHFTD
jgi:hypothetical protein